MSGRLKDNIIIVTGGAGLIGKHIVNFCEKEGAKVINVDLSHQTDLEVGTYQCDLTDYSAILKLVSDVKERYGRINGLVNNAYPRTIDWGMKFEDIPYQS